VGDHTSNGNYFNRNTEMRPEVIEGLVREGQLVAFAGPYGIGKTPVGMDLTIALIYGLQWCQRRTVARPVIVFDFESAAPYYKCAIRNICSRRGVPLPNPELLDVYLQNDSAQEPNISRLLKALSDRQSTLRLVAELLQAKPSAVVFMDPVELLFRFDTRDKMHVLTLYRDLRLLLTNYPRAVLWPTFNLRKQDRRTPNGASLLTNPRACLEEVSGSLDILNRSDVRLGMDFQDERIRVINGIRRSEEMDPFLLRSVGDKPGELAGFELCAPDELEMKFAFSPRQLEHWQKLPPEFRFEEAAKAVPRASLWRLIARGNSLGLIEYDVATGVHRKLEAKRETSAAD
jgi:AAA domain